MGTFAERLKQLREERKLTQQDLAEQVGVSRSTIGGYEAPSKHREPDFNVVRKLASFFNVSTDFLLGRDNNKKLKEKDPTETLALSMSERGPLTEEEKESLRRVFKKLGLDE